MAPLRALHGDERANAILGWALTAVVAATAVESFLTGALLWGGFALLVVAVTAIPAVSTGDLTVFVHWPLLLSAALAAIVRAFGLFPEITGYVAVATLALVVVVELDEFTPVDMSRRFAVGFAVLTTMAVQALWTIAQYASDRWVGTEFLRSQTELQWDFVAVTVVGFLMGAVFLWYFDRVDGARSADRPSPSP